MIELLIAGLFVTLALLIFARRGGPIAAGFHGDDRRDIDSADLPCPWCRGPTSEDDARCATCGQRFG